MKTLTDLAVDVGKQLAASGQTVTTAESCTGGGIAYVLTEVAGSSGWFERGFVTYSNQAKEDMVGVSIETLGANGAVSEAVAEEMASGALAAANADFAVSVSGIAGPGGGTKDKPVGMVCFGWAFKDGRRISDTQYFDGDRHKIRVATIEHSLRRLLFEIQQ
ncbi:damage-inducible protein CinA [Veronia nyctiphanis]|uniref:Damage-inducible protein CinA n=1 Tax=Veronia nyctiphanis TaxID=1278244 RepID=A0A4Q0YNC3_9GAMM|nr:nicotinamide-nucleotide amidase [Veronia nyctiphanis]RXJ72326.1 damage-inducible protein CinA [Veronia nyctiphanis]